MDFQLFASTFVTIFLAELGDKTQLAAFSMSAGAGSKLPVFLGSSLALILTSALAVGAGSLLGQFVSPVWIKRASGALFIVLGAIYIYESFGDKVSA